MNFEFKNSNEIKEKDIINKEDKPDNSFEVVENKIDKELNNLEKNAAELTNTIDSLGGEEKFKEILEKDEEEEGNIFKQLRKIVSIGGAIIAIPITYGIVKPEAFNKFKEVNEETVLTIGLSAVAVTSILMIISGLRSGELQKGIKEEFKNSKKAFTKDKKD
jgi:hypothetical protein